MSKQFLNDLWIDWVFTQYSGKFTSATVTWATTQTTLTINATEPLRKRVWIKAIYMGLLWVEQRTGCVCLIQDFQVFFFQLEANTQIVCDCLAQFLRKQNWAPPTTFCLVWCKKHLVFNCLVLDQHVLQCQTWNLANSESWKIRDRQNTLVASLLVLFSEKK